MTKDQFFHSWEGMKVGCSGPFSTVTTKIRKFIGFDCTTKVLDFVVKSKAKI